MSDKYSRDLSPGKSVVALVVSPMALPTHDVVAEAFAAADRRMARRQDVEVSVDDAPALIPPGLYEAAGLDHECIRYPHYGPARAKLVVNWGVVFPDSSVEFGRRVVVLPRHYNVEPRKKGYSAPPHGAFTREWMIVTGRRPRRGERASGRAFMRVMCRVEVGTVEKDARGNPLGAAAYSVIRRVVERLAGGAEERKAA